MGRWEMRSWEMGGGGDGGRYQSKIQNQTQKSSWSVARVKTSKTGSRRATGVGVMSTSSRHVPKPFVIPVAPTLDVETLASCNPISHSPR